MYFLISENDFLISENQLENDFLISENQFLISENVQIFYIRKWFSDMRNNFWYQKIIFWYEKLFSDIRKSKFPLVFAKISSADVLESQLGHDPVVTSSQ